MGFVKNVMSSGAFGLLGKAASKGGALSLVSPAAAIISGNKKEEKKPSLISGTKSNSSENSRTRGMLY